MDDDAAGENILENEGIAQAVPMPKPLSRMKGILRSRKAMGLAIGFLSVVFFMTLFHGVTYAPGSSAKKITKIITTRVAAVGSKVVNRHASASNTLISGSGNIVKNPIPVLSKYRIGISFGDTLAFENTSQLDSTFADAKSLGVNWIRFDMAWDDVQPTSSSSYNWSATDNIVNQANKYGLNSLPVLAYTPVWARPTDCMTSDKCAPGNDSQFAAYATAAVKRYSGMGVHTWEVWNEPNLYTFWQPNPSPIDYTKLLEATYPAIKNADPTATVITGGLGSLDLYKASVGQLTFLTDMYADGAGPYFDAVGYHPYSYPAPPSYVVSWSGWSMMDETPTSIRSIMVADGDANKQIWITEYGAPTDGPGTGATSLNWSTDLGASYVDDTLQAEMATQGVAYYKANPWLGSFFWYSYQDLGSSTDTTENFFGLLNFNGSQKLSYDAFKNAIATPPL